MVESACDSELLTSSSADRAVGVSTSSNGPHMRTTLVYDTLVPPPSIAPDRTRSAATSFIKYFTPPRWPVVVRGFATSQRLGIKHLREKPVAPVRGYRGSRSLCGDVRPASSVGEADNSDRCSSTWMGEDERLADRAALIDAAIGRVRGRAQSHGGLVVLEVDAYKAITDLRIASHAMSSDPARLATVIANLHRQACERASTAAEQAYGEVIAGPAAPAQAVSAEWEDPGELGPTRITFSM
ncbi:YbaB/EbfC family nucleoid-associated protein [Nocardia aurantiaca]|nr:YbaB/EbfC family nucleoid-associated protein [Nocardia aurantiaca]